jgi:hypothetical protein
MPSAIAIIEVEYITGERHRFTVATRGELYRYMTTLKENLQVKKIAVYELKEEINRNTVWNTAPLTVL